MGTFGGQAYFEGPVETKSPVLSPGYGIPNAGLSRRNSSSGSKDGELKVYDGLAGEATAASLAKYELDLAKNNLRQGMAQMWAETNGNIPDEVLAEYNKKSSLIAKEEIRLEAQEATLKKRKEIGMKTLEGMSGQMDNYLADTSGNFITDGEGGYLTGNDLGNIIQNAEAVPDQFLNYQAPDIQKYHETVRGIFKGLGKYSIGVNKKAQLIGMVASGYEPIDAIETLGLDAVITGTSNEKNLVDAMKDFSSQVQTDPEFNRQHNYSYNLWKLSNSDDEKTEDELYSSYISDTIIPKADKQTSIVESANAGGLGIGGNGSDKDDDKYIRNRFGYAAGTGNFYRVQMTSPTLAYKNMDPKQNKAFQDALLDTRKVDSYLSSMGYNENDPGYDRKKSQMNNISYTYQSEYVKIHNLNIPEKEKQMYENQLNETVRQRVALLSDVLTDQEKLGIIGSANNSKATNITLNRGNMWHNPHYKDSQVNEIAYAPTSMAESLYGWSMLTRGVYTMGIANISDETAEDFTSFKVDRQLKDIRGVNFSIGLGESFKGVHEWEGLANAHFVNMTSYVRGYPQQSSIDITGDSKVDNNDVEFKNGIVITVKMKPEDYEKFKQNKVMWGYNKKGSIDQKMRTIGELYDSGVLSQTAVNSDQTPGDAYMGNDNMIINERGGMFYVTILAEDSKTMYDNDQEEYIQKTKGKDDNVEFPSLDINKNLPKPSAFGTIE